MARAGGFKVSGIRELETALAGFKKSTARSILERALKRAAGPILEAAKSLAPVDTGALKNSIKLKVVRGVGAGRKAYAKARKAGASADEAGAAAHAANTAAAGQGLRGWLAAPARLRAFNWTMAALLVASLWPVVTFRLP